MCRITYILTYISILYFASKLPYFRDNMQYFYFWNWFISLSIIVSVGPKSENTLKEGFHHSQASCSKQTLPVPDVSPPITAIFISFP